MLKAAVFDDEYIVLKGLREMIDWAGFGIELAGTASDGLSALSLFRSERPDMIFTDIRMPGMDGLQLIEEVMREAPETYCVVFSGFNEFEYVKRAINLDVVDYLEKPITIQSVEKAIRKVLDRIGRQKEIRELKQASQNNRRELLEKATLDLLLIGAEAEAKWRESFGPDAQRVQAVTVIAAAADELAPPEGAAYDAVAVRHGQERMIVFFHYDVPAQEFWEHAIGEFEHAEMPVGSGGTKLRVSEASLSCKEALRALRTARFLGEKGMIRFEDLGDLADVPEGVTEREEAIILSLRSGNKAVLLEQIDSFIQWLQSGKFDPEVTEHEMLKLIYLLLEEAKKSAGDKSFRLHDSMPHVEFGEMAAKGRVAEWFRSQIERIADVTIDARGDSRHAAVVRACHFIRQNCTRDLTLQEVSEHVGMNQTYFSVLFKEEMGESYIKYVTRYRMELAKSLLGKGLKVNEVSEKVGYHTYRHFSEVFKKYTGVAPGQYKEQHVHYMDIRAHSEIDAVQSEKNGHETKK